MLGWCKEELDNKIWEVLLGYFPNPSVLAPGDITMQEVLPRTPHSGIPRGEADPLQPPGVLPPLIVDYSMRPGIVPALYTQAACFASGQVASSSLEGVVCLAKAFLELPTQCLVSMERQAGNHKPQPKKAPSTVHGPSWHHVLIMVTPLSTMGPTPDVLLCQVKDKLSLHHSTLVTQSASEAYGGFSVSTDQVATEAELGFIREVA